MIRKRLLELRDFAGSGRIDLCSINGVIDVRELPKALTCLDEYHLIIASMANRIKNFVIVYPQPNPALFYEQSLFREIVEPNRLMWVKEHDYKYKTPDRWEKLATKQFYVRPRTLGLVWGAYLLPDDIQIGERVYVEELIEDVHLHGNTLATDGIAVWTGDSLEFEEEHWDKLRERKYWKVG